MPQETQEELLAKEVQSLLSTSFGDKVIVAECHSTDLLSLGENFAGELKKIHAKIRRDKDAPIEEYDFVMKKGLYDMPEVGDWTVFMKREIFFYTDVIPFYARIELEHGIDGKEAVGGMVPRLYGHRLSLDSKGQVDSAILLENLKTKNYYVLSKIKGLHLNHAKKAIRLLAKFHAVGIVAKKKYPDEFEKIKSVAIVPGFYYLHGDDALRKRFIDKFLRNDKRYNKNIAIIEEIEARYKNNRNNEMTTSEPWATICHADYWTNNLMFHSDDEANVDDMKFVDFQSYCYSNVYTDLCHFLCSSLDDDTFTHHFDAMIDLYHKTFITYLKKMKIDVEEFSRQAFDEQFRKDAPHELIHNIIALLYHTIDSGCGENQKEILDYILTCEGNPVLHYKLAKVLKVYEDKNWLQ